MFETGYLRVPDGDTVADDIVLEARNGSTEIAFTREELDGAEHVGEGVYRLQVGRAAALPLERDGPLSAVAHSRSTMSKAPASAPASRPDAGVSAIASRS